MPDDINSGLGPYDLLRRKYGIPYTQDGKLIEPQDEAYGEFGTDTEVLAALIDSKEPKVEMSRPAYVAGLARGAAKMGTIGGRSADTSGLSEYADKYDKQRAVDEKRLKDRRERIYDAIEEKRGHKRKLGENIDLLEAKSRTKGDEYATRLEDKREDKKTAQEFAMQKQNRAHYNAIKRNELSAKQRYKDKMRFRFEKLKPLSYQQQVKSMNTTERVKFNLAAMAFRGLIDMKDALEGGDWMGRMIIPNRYHTARQRFVESFGRSFTGAAMPALEVKTYKEMAPGHWDYLSGQAQYKMEANLAQVMGDLWAMGINPKDVMAQDEELRHELWELLGNRKGKKKKKKKSGEEKLKKMGNEELKKKLGHN